jgi:hypothetical protein
MDDPPNFVTFSKIAPSFHAKLSEIQIFLAGETWLYSQSWGIISQKSLSFSAWA